MAKKGFDTSEIDTGSEKTVVLPSIGGLDLSAQELRSVEVVDKPMADSLVSELAFMEEKVDVMLHESTDPNAENPVQVSVNGINQFFLRGQQQTVRRKYVEVLARAKKTAISTPEMTNQVGERVAAIRKATALHYPFSVTRDDNPRGQAWLRGILAQH